MVEVEHQRLHLSGSAAKLRIVDEEVQDGLELPELVAEEEVWTGVEIERRMHLPAPALPPSKRRTSCSDPRSW